MSAPARPDEPSARRREERRVLPVLAVLAVIAFVTGGSRLVGSAVEGPTGAPVDVGATVTVTPEPGWDIVSSAEDAESSQVLFQHGTAGLLVIAVPAGGGSAPELAQLYVDEVLSGRFARLTIGDPAGDGPNRLSFGYMGIPLDGAGIEGIVTVEVGPSGTGAVFDGFAPTGSLGAAVGDLAEMVRTAEVA